jgi:fatty-acyl-CoA synthase
VSERAAAPKDVRVLDVLPLTAVGKPYQLPLRADATRRVLTEAVAGLDGVEGLTVEAGSGTVAVTVTLRDRAAAAEVERRVGGSAVPCRIVTRHGTDG